jgi:SAM-dependent methyltransferase
MEEEPRKGEPMNYLTSTDYWIEAARHPKLDLDQVASQNYSLPPDVHKDVRSQQVGYLENILRQRQGPKHVLDLGCGPGVWALQLADLADSWLGYDIAPAFVDHARQQAAQKELHHLQFEVGSLLEVRCDRLFDVVVLGGILGYIEDADLLPLLRNAAAHLQPGGLVYVRISVIPGIYPRITLKKSYPIHYRKVAHYVETFREAGFRVTVERDYAFTEASLATAYTAMARWLGRTGMTAYRVAQRLRPLSFGLARRLLDLTPLPQSMQFILS